MSIVVEKKLAYITGNSVLVISASSALNFFEGTVSSYTYDTGAMIVNNIKNVNGSFTASAVYNVNLDGIDGPTGYTGPTGVTGPAGINGTTSGLLLYLNQGVSSGINGYSEMSIFSNSNATVTVNSVLTTGTTLITSFGCTVSSLNVSPFIPRGVWDMNLFAAAATVADQDKVTLTYRLYGRTAGGAETHSLE